MPKFKNVSPLGALDLPLIRRVVQRDEVIEVTTAQAKHLRGQTGTWKPVSRTSGDEPDGGSDTGEPADAVEPDGGEAAPAADQTEQSKE